jgi:hypothetical protein
MMKSYPKLAMLCILVTASVAAQAEQDRSQIRHLAVDELKAIYLACSDDAMNGRLPTGLVAGCSIVYEDLKQRGFGGDFDRFLAWSRSQPSDARPAATLGGQVIPRFEQQNGVDRRSGNRK